MSETVDFIFPHVYLDCLKVRRQVGGDDLAVSVDHATVIRRSAAPDEALPFPSFPLSPTNVPTVTVRVNGSHKHQ